MSKKDLAIGKASTGSREEKNASPRGGRVVATRFSTSNNKSAPDQQRHPAWSKTKKICFFFVLQRRSETSRTHIRFIRYPRIRATCFPWSCRCASREVTARVKGCGPIWHSSAAEQQLSVEQPTTFATTWSASAVTANFSFTVFFSLSLIGFFFCVNENSKKRKKKERENAPQNNTASRIHVQSIINFITSEYSHQKANPMNTQ